MNNDPASTENNLHHTESHIYKSQDEVVEELLGRGDGDPDVYSIPDEDTDIM